MDDDIYTANAPTARTARTPPGSPESSLQDRVARDVLSVIATGQAHSKAEIIRVTGLARSTVTEHLRALQADGLVVETGNLPTGGRGRPARALAVAPTAGVVLAADIGTTKTTLAIADIQRNVLSRREIASTLDSPTEMMDTLAAAYEQMLADDVAPGIPVRLLVAGLPSPVDSAGGRPIHPPLMPGWDRFPVADSLAERLGTRVILDNDVNLMAIGEYAAAAGNTRTPLLFLHISSGIGCGIITNDGVVLRGADGAAGDVGHLRTQGHDDTVCRCGNIGCIESVASITSITTRLRNRLELSQDQPDPDLIALLRDGNPFAVNEVRKAAMEIGAVAVTLVHVFNPAALILNGPLALASDDLLAGVRAVVYRRALPLATRALRIGNSTLGGDAGVIGAIHLAVQRAFSSDVGVV